jgi:putative colanic acid biosynthesis glycosyltransferase
MGVNGHNMEAPRFSIVTVTLNCAEDAARTAQSVLGQTYGDYEYIVKDGGSQDGTADQMRALGARVFVSPDRGIYDAMNQALDHCRGEYVYFLNAGDTFAGPDVLSRLAAGIDQRAAICYGELELQPMRTRTRHPDRLSSYYLFRKNLNHQAWLARRDVYLKLGKFDLRYRYVADQAFVWQAVLRERLPAQHLDLVIANFEYGGTSTRRSASTTVRQERWELVRRFFRPWQIGLYGLVSLYFLNPLKARLWYLLHPSVR